MKPDQHLDPEASVTTAGNEPLRMCKNGGYLVNGQHRMGAPQHYQFEGLLSVIGCSRLRCDVCSAVVVHATGRALAEGVLPRYAYWGPDGVPSPELVVSARSPHERLYCCKCWCREETGQTVMQPPPPHDVMDMIWRWRCMGHPALPRHLDGKDHLSVAEERLGTLVENGARHLAADDLMLMLKAADAELHDALLTLLRDVLATGERLRLTRALAVVEAEPASFIDHLASMKADDVRLRVRDETRRPWTIRDRLAHVVSACISRADAWSKLGSLAEELLVGTQSRDLVRILIAQKPDLVADALLAANAKPLQRP